MDNYYRKSRRKKGGKRLKESNFNWWLAGLATAIVVCIVSLFATGISCSSYLNNVQLFTVEAKSENANLAYDYRNFDDLNWWSKAFIPLFYEVSDNINTDEPGNYGVIYNARLFFMSDKAHLVDVVDTTPPEIFLEPLDEEITYQSLQDFVDPGYYAVDNCDGYVETYLEISRSKPCWYTITYTATDKSGNTAERTREINVISGQVALTFDDGPSLTITPEILTVLRNNNVKATFFILGYNSDKEYLVRQEFEEGHTIGYHGTSHQYKDIYTSLDVLVENFTSLEEKVIALTGYSSKLIRFPGGSSNTVSFNYCEGIMSAAATAVADEGYTYFDWNVDSGDAGSANTAESVYNNVVNGIRPGHFNVVLMHDSGSKQHTLDALQRIIDYCVENDFELVKLDSTSPQITHRIAN